MNRIVMIVVSLALILGVVFVAKQKRSSELGSTITRNGESGPGSGSVESKPDAGAPPGGRGSAVSNPSGGTSVGSPSIGGATIGGSTGKTSPNAPTTGGGATGASSTTGTPATTGSALGTGSANVKGETKGSPNGTTPGAPGSTTITGATPELNDGTDGIGAPQPGDDGMAPPQTKAPTAPTLAGVKTPKVWLVAADLRKLPSAKTGAPFEVGNSDGTKGTPWKNREGAKAGDGLRAKNGTTGTFVRGLVTTDGPFDAVAVCMPGAKDCLNSTPSQIKLGLDLNHPDSWVAGADHGEKSSKGGSSFTALFVAARGSQAGNPLLENQNGEGGATKGPFLGWVGTDLVGSIHGLQGIVGMNAAAIPSAWSGRVTPEIYTLRFDRKKSELKLFLVGEKNSAVQVQAIQKGDGPDNDQYAAIAMGSKNPGKASVTYVLEAATFSRALEDREICAIHKDWNKRYALKIPNGQLKPCP